MRSHKQLNKDFSQMVRVADNQTVRQTDRHTDRQIDGQTDRQRQTDRLSELLSVLKTDKQGQSDGYKQADIMAQLCCTFRCKMTPNTVIKWITPPPSHYY